MAFNRKSKKSRKRISKRSSKNKHRLKGGSSSKCKGATKATCDLKMCNWNFHPLKSGQKRRNGFCDDKDMTNDVEEILEDTVGADVDIFTHLDCDSIKEFYSVNKRNRDFIKKYIGDIYFKNNRIDKEFFKKIEIINENPNSYKDFVHICGWNNILTKLRSHGDTMPCNLNISNYDSLISSFKLLKKNKDGDPFMWIDYYLVLRGFGMTEKNANVSIKHFNKDRIQIMIQLKQANVEDSWAFNVMNSGFFLNVGPAATTDWRGYDTIKIHYIIKLRMAGFKHKYCIKSVERMGSPGWPFTAEILDGIIEKKNNLLRDSVWLSKLRKAGKRGPAEDPETRAIYDSSDIFQNELDEW